MFSKVHLSSVRLEQKWSIIQIQPIDLYRNSFGLALES